MSAARDVERVRFLWEAGHVVPEPLAQHTTFAMRSAAAACNLRLADSVSRRVCSNCSALLIPGVNCKIRLCKRRGGKGGGGDEQRPPEDPPKGGQRAGEAGEGDAGGRGGGGARVVAREWWDGYGRGKHSAARNEVVCACGACGARLCFGGSEAAGVSERRERRGRERRGQRFREAEKAQSQMRFERAAAFIDGAGLAEGGGGRKRKAAERPAAEGGVLPATLSARAEQALETAFASRAYERPYERAYQRPYEREGGRGHAPASPAPAAVAGQGAASLDAATESEHKKKKKKESLEDKAASLAAPPPGGRGGGAPGGKKSLYDLMQEMLGS